mgnify:CR=1 FL=1
MAADDQDDLQTPSKSQRKREALAQQELGARLTALSPSKLDRLNLPSQLAAALTQFQRLPNSRGARKRQLQYIGRIMRDIDCETIEAGLTALATTSDKAVGNQPVIDLNEISGLILAQGDPAITALVNQYSQLERQKLRQLYRRHQQADAAQADSIKKRLLNYLSERLAA